MRARKPTGDAALSAVSGQERKVRISQESAEPVVEEDGRRVATHAKQDEEQPQDGNAPEEIIEIELLAQAESEEVQEHRPDRGGQPRTVKAIHQHKIAKARSIAALERRDVREQAEESVSEDIQPR